MILAKRAARFLPADVMPAVFALSVNRKLRYGYEGPLFRFKRGGYEYDYPEEQVQDGDKIIKIYDQKVHKGHTPYHAVQEDMSLQPTVQISNGIVAKFELGQYMKIDLPSPFSLGDFTLTVKGSGVQARPLIGGWGYDKITIEPSSVGRVSFNNKKVILGDINDKVTRIFTGTDKAQNNNRVLEANTGTSQGASLLPAGDIVFSHLNIGRMDDRYFEGYFSEATLHESLSESRSKKVWEGANV
jgi:hypothetical protein